MDSNTITKELNHIFSQTLDVPEVNLTLQTTAEDIEEWDSLTHIQLVVNIEKHFKIKFSASEIYKWKNIGDMVNSIGSKITSNA